MLARTAELWLNHQDTAKASMHGFPFVAGQQLHGPPSAGELAVGIPPSPHGRYAIAVTSTVRGQHVTTQRTSVRLDRQGVDRYRRDGRIAARLYGEVCVQQAGSTMSGFGWCVPLSLLPRLSREDQALVEAARARMADGQP
jgi:hypothetical protein